MNISQRNSMIDRIQGEYDIEKKRNSRGVDSRVGRGEPDTRALLLIAETLVEIDHSLQFFVDEFKKDQQEGR